MPASDRALNAASNNFPADGTQSISRRKLLGESAAVGAALLSAVHAASAAGSVLSEQNSADEQTSKSKTDGVSRFPIIDTHQHLWDLNKISPPWLKGAPEILNQNYGLAEYAAATAGLNVTTAVYMEVDVHPDDHIREADLLLEICRQKDNPTVAAVISGRPNSPGFAEYIQAFKEHPEIKGIRQVLHARSAAPGLCLEPQFVASMKLLGSMGLSFDLCMRPAELSDGLALAQMCPDTLFILDHCGNAAPTAFLPKQTRTAEPAHDPEQWKRDITSLAACKNVICKISGIIASAPADVPYTESLSPIINHCLDQFGPDRVVFGGDWPVCLLGSSYRNWVEALREIISNRSATDREKLWFSNAQRIYRLPV